MAAFVLPFVGVVLFIGHRLGALRHPVILLSVLTAFLMPLSTVIGGLEWYQDFITSVMKPVIPWPEPSP